MYLVHYFDQHEYEFVMTLHSTRAAAEAAYAALLRRYVIKKGDPLPPKEKWDDLYDEGTGEAVHLYEVNCDDGNEACPIAIVDTECAASPHIVDCG
jgi:hypothetical protein